MFQRIHPVRPFFCDVLSVHSVFANMNDLTSQMAVGRRRFRVACRCCPKQLLKLHLNLAVFVNLEFGINFDSFDYPANGGTLSHECINSVLAF